MKLLLIHWLLILVGESKFRISFYELTIEFLEATIGLYIP